MAIQEVISTREQLGLPFPASTANDVYDLLYWDDSANVCKKASARTDLTTAALNQADFAPLFIGVAGDQRLSTETSTGSTSNRRVILEGVFDCDCASATFEIGDYVGVARDSNNSVNFNQKVVGVAGPHLAIGRVVKREGSSVTKVRCFLSAYEFGFFNYTRGNRQLNGAIAATDADTTLTVSQLAGATIATMTPTAARKIIMPSEARSTGLMLYINNLAGATHAINVRNSADGATQISIPASKAGIVWCDGTTWRGIVGA